LTIIYSKAAGEDELGSPSRGHAETFQACQEERVMRTVLGFVLAPLTPALLLGGFPLFLGARFGEFVWSLGFAMAIGYPVALVAGLPLFFFLRWRRWVSLWHYVVVGMFVGAGLYLWLGQAAHAAWLFISMLCTTIAAASFWVIARPDKDAFGVRSM
jgi:hypothetical protein